MPPLEIGLLIIFVLYIVFPFRTPAGIAGMIDSPLGMIVVFCVTLFLFFYTNPILGILYILVAYELIRRSSAVGGGSDGTSIVQYVPSQDRKDAELRAMNPPQTKTLEEEMVDQRAPLPQVGRVSSNTTSDFKPVTDKTIAGASLI
jgi:hypothetical protein